MLGFGDTHTHARTHAHTHTEFVSVSVEPTKRRTAMLGRSLPYTHQRLVLGSYASTLTSGI